MSTIKTRDDTGIYYNDWARDSPRPSAMTDCYPGMPGKIRCSFWLLAEIDASSMTAKTLNRALYTRGR